MDWYLDASSAQSVSSLRREISSYLARHCAPGSDVDGAELVVSELLGNVVRHAPGHAWVSLTWGDERPELTVYDLGPTFDPDEVLENDEFPDPLAESGRGLLLVSALAPRLESAARRAGGSRVSATLPVTRPAEDTFEVSPRRGSSLPSLSEALPQGGFGRESFLRALVVELAQAVERTGGPAMSEEIVSQVGSGVGAQMEAEYRLAREVAGRLSPQQIGEALVRLKHAIDGNFTLVEVSDDRLVLTNTRCPFGEAVMRAPALCRMTSSVFGGIAARNSDEGTASVVLEERIAVGDPGCRVVVHLGNPGGDTPSFAHRYSAASNA